MSKHMDMHKYPDGWLGILVEAVIRHDLYFAIDDLTCEDTLTDSLLVKATGSTLIKDHWGNCGERLVFEPYGNHDKQADQFAKYLQVNLVSGGKPEWHPSCRRYAFVMRDVHPSAEAFAELVRCVNWEFRERCKAQDAVKASHRIINSVGVN